MIIPSTILFMACTASPDPFQTFLIHVDSCLNLLNGNNCRVWGSKSISGALAGFG
jgi:hypothetical protein